METTSINTSTISYSLPLSKNQILERLLKAEQITFDEMVTLMEKEFYSTPGQVIYPTYPQWPVTYTANQ